VYLIRSFQFHRVTLRTIVPLQPLWCRLAWIYRACQQVTEFLSCSRHDVITYISGPQNRTLHAQQSPTCTAMGQASNSWQPLSELGAPVSLPRESLSVGRSV